MDRNEVLDQFEQARQAQQAAAQAAAEAAARLAETLAKTAQQQGGAK